MRINKKVYCKYYRYCKKNWEQPFGSIYICVNEHNKMDTLFERLSVEIEEVNENNDCLYFENKKSTSFN